MRLNIIVVLTLFFFLSCHLIYSGDGKYVTEGTFPFINYSIEFPEVPLDQDGIYKYSLNNYFTSNDSSSLEFEIIGENNIIPTIISSKIKYEIYNKRDELIGYFASPINRRELAFFKQKLDYPTMSWYGQCNKYFDSHDYDLRQIIATNPNNQNLLKIYVDSYPISECRFSPDYSSDSKINLDLRGQNIKSFKKYIIILSISEANKSLKNIRGRLTLRSNWK